MSEELQEGGSMPQGAEVPLVDPVVPEDTTPPAEGEKTDAKADEKADEKPADGKPDYSHIPKKFMKADGTPDFDALAKSYTGLEKKLGQRPNMPASSVEDYSFDFGDLDVAALGVTDESVNAFKEQALKAGFTKDQYSFVMNMWKENVTKLQVTADQAEQKLKESWGKDFDRNVDLAKTAFREYAPSDADPNDPIWNHPVVMGLLARIGGEIGEDSLAGKSNGNRAPDMTEAEVAQIMKSKEYQNGDRALHAKVTAWYQKHYS